MKLLVAAQNWPHRGHTRLSANIAVFELIREFARASDCAVAFVCTPRADWADRATDGAADEAAARRDLAEIGVEVLPPLVVPAPPARMRRIGSVLWPRLDDYFPETRVRAEAAALVREARADAVFVPWSEMTTQVFAEVPALKVAYYGDPDPKTRALRTAPPFLPRPDPLRALLMGIRQRHFERLHLREMRRFDLFGEVAANDVEYYRARGVEGAFYCRMVYIDRFGDDWRARREAAERDDPAIIVGNIGQQTSTGNMLGLRYMGAHFLDSLRRAMGGRAYEVHLLGGGRLPDDIAARLARPEVRNLGFVDDIDAALLAAPVFLCLNNATRYKFNQSRYLHVWSLGGCIVAHRDAALSMPEMKHRENALLGRDADEIADLVAEAAADRALRRRLGEAGFETFRRRFTAESVVGDLRARIDAALGLAPAPRRSEETA